MIKYIDLFAGAGGWEAGLSDLGWDCKGLYEWNEAACKTLDFNFSGKVNCVDLYDYKNIKFPKVDVVIGSPPCQGFSNEGKKIKNDTRNSLVWSFVEIIRKVDPDVWVFENVPGFKRLYNGEYFKQLEIKLNKLDYYWSWFILDSSDYGVPQYRKRFVAIGSKRKKPPIPTIENFDTPNLFGQKPKVSFWDAISDLPKVSHGERIGKFRYTRKVRNEYQELMRKDSETVYNHTTQNHSERVLEKIRSVPVGGNMKNIVGNFSENKQHYEGGYRRAKKDVPSYTAYWTRGMTSIHPELDRFLSPRECARIQSFSDKVIFQGSTIQNYTQICNAVPPLLSKAVCKSIIENELLPKREITLHNNRYHSISH